MPRACPVEPHAVSYCSGEREAPRDKPVASRNRAALCSGEREAPRDKPVASRAVWMHLFLKDHKRRARFKSRSAVGNPNSKNHFRTPGCRSREELFWKLFGSSG